MTDKNLRFQQDELRRMFARAVANHCRRESGELDLDIEFARTEDCAAAQKILKTLFPNIKWAETSAPLFDVDPDDPRLKEPFKAIKISTFSDKDKGQEMERLWKEYGGAFADVSNIDHLVLADPGPNGKTPAEEALGRQMQVLEGIRKTIQAGLN
jgi:hypothetical protein